MRASIYLGLLASVSAVQDTAVVFNLFQLESTLTAIGSDASATTYKNSCPSGAVGISAVPSELRDNAGATPTPAPTAAARLRRQDQSSSDIEDYTFCEPYTLVQGPSTYEMHLTDPSPGAWTLDMACKWQGAITAADLTCTVSQSGSIPGPGATGVTTSVVSSTELSDMEAFQTVAVVSASGGSGSPAASASQTASGSGTALPSGSASGSDAAGSRSTGLAPAVALPTGAVAFVGGAAGIFAAALAL
ncbi:predicted protein [Plenodomus lingam JN3]|uniref:GPI anchored protein n=1 Tax=Leptosphaeria maculans (strain JN3 / isolate v23.1.3 / race Av1-4-5-6-7-8) TaxID=985895 RepID=E4ZGH4_LEPMJ|nr:predicted protein [Plenodomus lingam JN3]CBX90394.1 predicted protein [Plenodomus lingam JN3]